MSTTPVRDGSGGRSDDRAAAGSLIGNLDLLLVVLIAALAAVLALAAAPAALRLPVGILAALVLPGYAVSTALFPPGRIDAVERAALAISVSLGVIVLAAPFLDRLPGGLSPESLVWAVTAPTFVATGIGWWRRRHGVVPADRAAVLDSTRAAWRTGRRRAVVLAGLVAVVVLAVLAGGWLGRTSSPAAFYLLGPGGTTAGLPVAATAGVPVTVTLGITNPDSSDRTYSIVVESASSRVGGRGPIVVAAGSTWTGPVTFTLASAGRGQEVSVLLYAASGATPDRSLRIVVDAVAPSPSA